ncbi:MAG TPA: alpha-L-fucosidase [Bryobacteraceae bacterium]|nr:alpha-L-fucosidase [Bryobacteraceae bacterium]
MTRRQLLQAAAAALPLSGAATRYESTWDSIDRRPSPPWYQDAKFGIFIHWGLYSVPAFAAPRAEKQNPYAEWYWNSLTKGKSGDPSGSATWDFHRRVYGAGFEYQQFAPLFRAELFDPNRWAALFERSGAKYIVPTSKHHEGFALWPSKDADRTWGRPWNAVSTGPKRDLLGDLTKAVRARGLHMGFYYSLYEWYNPLWLKDKPRYVREHLFPQFKDVVTRYRPDIIFSDGEWELTSAEWHSPELLAWLFNDSPAKDNVVIDDRWGKDTRHKHGGYYTTEYTAGLQSGAHPWEESRGMGFSYGYNRMETLQDYHTSRELTLMLIDIVSRGGNFLLDIGPTADGRIPIIMEERLTEIGDWLRANGEAIYGTRNWRSTRQWSTGTVPTFEEKEFRGEYNIRKLVDEPAPGQARIEAFFTAKGNTVYAIVPRRLPRQLVLKDLRAADAVLLESGDKLPVHATGRSLTVTIPDAVRDKSSDRVASVIKLGSVT